MLNVFLSYAREDLEAAHRLYVTLNGIPAVQIWFDKESLLPGQLWETEIRSAIAGADYFVLLVSKESTAKRGFYQREVRAALDVLAELPERRTYLIPARLDECEMHFEKLSAIQYVDLFPDFLAGVDRILRAMASHTRGPTSGTAQSRSTLRFTSHQARFVRSEEMFYFLNVTNSSDRPIEITHLWYEDAARHVPARPHSRPLPKRLEVSETWSSWIPVVALPATTRANAYERYRLRLSSGEVVACEKESSIPPYGSVAGGPVAAADIDYDPRKA